MKDKVGGSISPEDLQAAWDFFDPEGKGSLGVEDIRKRLAIFYRNVSAKEVKFLLSNHNEVSQSELEGILRDTRLVNFDPSREAFKLYDPLSTGYMDQQQLKKFFQSLGYGNLTDDDIYAIVNALDIDQDGKIGIDDFRAAIKSRDEHKPAK